MQEESKAKIYYTKVTERVARIILIPTKANTKEISIRMTSARRKESEKMDQPLMIVPNYFLSKSQALVVSSFTSYFLFSY